MSRTLNLVEQLLSRGRKLHELGRTGDALVVLSRLGGLRELPAEAAEETQARLGEIQLGRRKYIRARRHLAAALTHQPESAKYHRQMASAFDSPEKADEERSLEHYRQSLQCDPKQPRCLGEFGLLALRLGQVEEGLQALRRAAELAPDEPEVVGRLAEGLRQADQIEEARGVLQSARFRHPRDRRFHKLWNDFQFCCLHEAQQDAYHEDGNDTANDPMLLPFVCAAHEPEEPGSDNPPRRDAPAKLQGPHAPRIAPLSDRKHA